MRLHQILGHHGILLAVGEGFCLVDHELIVALEPIRMAVRANVDFVRHNRVATHADFIQSGVFDNATRPLGTVC